MLVIHPNDPINFYDQFSSLLTSTCSHIKADALLQPNYYLNRSPTQFEEDVHGALLENNKGLPFQKIELFSGQKFPDIVAYVNEHKAFGVEVKTTKKNQWLAVGGSIMESTRINNVERIHVFFGKLCDPFDCLHRPYEDCVDDVKITHSPRYHLNLKLNEGKSFFHELGISYDELRNLDHPFDTIRDFFREKRAGKNEDVWWLEPESPNLLIRLWGNLPSEEKEQLVATGFAYCPEVFCSDYKKLAVMLAGRHGIVNPSLRDSFSAGGKFYHQLSNSRLPRIFQNYLDLKPEIFKMINTIPEADIRHYWGRKNVSDRVEMWKALASGYSFRKYPGRETQAAIRQIFS